MLARFWPIVCLIVMGIAFPACNQEGDGDPGAMAPQVNSSAALQVVDDAAGGLRFRLAFGYLRATAEHFDPSLPAHKMRHSVTVRALTTPVLRVDVWDNPGGLGLQAWFDQHLAFSVVEGGTVTRRAVGENDTQAIVVDQPSSPQADARRIAVFPSDGRMVRVTCFDATDAANVKAFDEVLASFEGEVVR